MLELDLLIADLYAERAILELGLPFGIEYELSLRLVQARRDKMLIAQCQEYLVELGIVRRPGYLKTWSRQRMWLLWTLGRTSLSRGLDRELPYMTEGSGTRPTNVVGHCTDDMGPMGDEHEILDASRARHQRQ